MANSTPPKFYVGQLCVLVLDGKSGWAPLNGEICMVATPRRKMNLWCCDWDGSNRNFQRGAERYEVTLADGSGIVVRESQLRANYDGDELSTWERFKKLTGIDVVTGLPPLPAWFPKVKRSRRKSPA